MITRLRQRVTRPVISHDDSGSMLLALFAIVILTALVSVVLMVTISQQAKTRKATDFTFASQAADTGVNNALLLANLNGAVGTVADVNHWTAALPQKGVSGDFMWSWYSTPRLGDPSTLDITATGCRNKGTVTAPVCTATKPRKMKAVLSGRVVENADNSGGEAAYVLTAKRSFNRALFADQDLIMQGSSKVTAYNSATGSLVPGSGQVATNGLADFGPLVSVGGIYMLNAQAHSSGDRCNDFETLNGQCEPDSTPRLIHDVGPKLTVSDKVITDQIGFPPCAGPLTAWLASEAGGLLGPGIQCYSSMNFDKNTTVSGTTLNPTMVYVTGPITIAAGPVAGPVKINVPLGATTPAASNVQIFSSGPVVSLGGGADSLTRTEVAWALWAPNALCAPSKPTGFVTVYGAMVCRKIFTPGEFVARWDEALLSLWPDDGVATIWDISAYEEAS